MRAAVVTGASSGIGLQIAKKLIALHFKVYGIARDFSKTSFTHEQFVRITCDITNTKQLCKTIEEIKQNNDEIYLLINNAGVGYFGPHEQLKPSQIEAMVATNLQAPLIATQLLLRNIKQSQGYIINISSITAKKSSTHGCAYAATKAGLTHFATSLFDEIRKTGAKVITIHPDMTRTPFYDHLDFREGDLPESYITAECIAEAVETILNQREGTVITEMTIRPQKHMITRKEKKKLKAHDDLLL
ncbi:3-oxoacyl-ACP reductase [Collibacillus ludicampi]|jgi:short-subunit dehydrogenase|uniref:3-oxoacyl-ACP reductase n=1 Tax=Collibacillus ludicampi TaxID=2771369 RepID=A0AAV4LK00_9BACL|nr:SDR family NAD(P)-dependent oxidoreductase [Collibacillus ludicampi]GIM48108.1 3-oxoacyl-ACP reductase [Collibacillus ludicampi]